MLFYRACLFIILGGSISLIGCGESAPTFKSADVSGTVTIAKAPLATGKIIFVNEGRAPDYLDIVDGKYSGKVTIGKHRVEIISNKKVPAPKTATGGVTEVEENIIAPEFNSASKLEADIPATGKTGLDFDVTLKK